MNDPRLRHFAQEENDHILFLLLRSGESLSSEDVVELAERNCGATARSFGEMDPLHAMALNTLAFVYTRNSVKSDVARESAEKAARILQGRGDEGEMLLEAQCLSAMARIDAGASASSAVAHVFCPGIANLSSDALRHAACDALSEILAASVFRTKVKGIVLQIVLRDVAVSLYEEVQAAGDPILAGNLGGHLMTFMEIYYASAGENS